MNVEFEWNPALHPHGEHGRWAKVEAAEAGAQSAADKSAAGRKAAPRSRSRRAGVERAADAPLAAEADDAVGHLAAAEAALKKAGPRGSRGRRAVKKAASFLVTGAVTAVNDLLAATIAAGDLNKAIEDRYGPAASKAITAATKATSHIVGVHQLPPTNVIPGTTLLKKLPFLAVAEAIHLFRHWNEKKKAVKSKRQKRLFEKAMVERANKLIAKRVKAEIGSAVKPGKLKVAELRSPAELSDGRAEGPDYHAVAAEALRQVQEMFDRWLAENEHWLAPALAPLTAAFDFNPEQHPKAKDGKFTTGGSESGSPAGRAEKSPSGKDKTAAPPAPPAPPLAHGTHPAEVRKSLADAHATLEKAGEAGKKGRKHLREAVSFLVARSSAALADIDESVNHRYGKRAGTVILAAGKCVGDLVPKLGGSDIMQDIDMEAVPSGDLLCTLPVVAVAEAIKQFSRLFAKRAAEPAGPKSNRQKRLHERALVDKANDKLDRHAKKSGVRVKKIKHSDVGEFSAGDDEYMKPIMKLVKKKFKKIRRQYEKWLAGRFDALKTDLAPLAPAAFAACVEAARRHAAAVTAELTRGAITLPTWTARMGAVFANVPVRAARTVWGGDVPPAAWNLAVEQAAAVRAHVAEFARRLADHEEDWGAVTAARADLYAQVGFSDLHEHERLAARSAGFAAERRVCSDDCRSCAECIRHAAASWRPIGTLPVVGDCGCASRCRCQFRFGR